MAVPIDLINTLLVLAIITNAVYGLIIYGRNRSSASNQLFFFLTITASAWGTAMLLLRMFIDTPYAIYFARLLFGSAVLIPAVFVYLASVFPRDSFSLSHIQKYVFPAIVALFVYISAAPEYLVDSVYHSGARNVIITYNNTYYVLFSTYLFVCFGWVYATLIRRLRKESDQVLRTRLFYILIGTIIPAAVSIVTNLILPSMGISQYNWVGPFSIVLSTGIITYGIFRHRIFDIRVISAELLVFTLWLISFIRTLLSSTPSEIVFNVFTLAVFILVGILLIRSINKEVDSRERLEMLTKKLQSTNERLKILDQQKSEFLSIATHQLRGPIAGIRGYLSLILDGSFGKVPKKARDVIEKIAESSALLAETVNDFLDVSRIEQGRMQYDMANFPLVTLIADIVNELKPLATEKGLYISFETACTEQDSVVHGDRGKLSHIFLNLIDNAIKYTEKGWVKARLERDGSILRFTVSDSGVGIAPDEIGTLFEKFVRTKGASSVNVNGTGLGLYVARQMVKAHDGDIWVESEGKGKGSTFVVELPANSD